MPGSPVDSIKIKEMRTGRAQNKTDPASLPKMRN